MSNFGGAEMLVCLFLALIVLGPERLPKVARQAGAVMRQLRQMSSGFQEELRSAIEDPQPKDFSARLAAVPDSTTTPELAEEVRAGDASDPDEGTTADLPDAPTAEGDDPPASGARATG
jgi:sec-independent protein translocase protein TatB